MSERHEQPETQEEVAGRVTNAAIGSALTLSIYLGDQLGLYKELDGKGPLTAQDLADRLNLSARWTAEWLYHQASNKLICTSEDATTFWLTDGQASVLARESGPRASPCFIAGMAGSLVHASGNAPRLLESFRQGTGFTFDALGANCACSVMRHSGPWLRHHLADLLAGHPDLHSALSGPSPHIADVGCGAGESLFVMAKAYPHCVLHGYDISSSALELANHRKAQEKLDNIHFFNPAKGQVLPSQPTYDLVLIYHALHDMTHPDEVLRAVRAALKDTGMLLIIDIKCQASHGANIREHPMAPLLYGFSVGVCLPSGMSAPGGMGLGTMGLTEEKARSLCEAAGLSRLDVLQYESALDRLYLVRP